MFNYSGKWTKWVKKWRTSKEDYTIKTSNVPCRTEKIVSEIKNPFHRVRTDWMLRKMSKAFYKSPHQYYVINIQKELDVGQLSAKHILKKSNTTERLPFHFSLWCIGGGNGNPLQCSCLENPRDGGAWWAAVYGVAQSRTQLKWFSSSSTSLKSQCHLCTFKIQSLLFCIILLYNEKLVTGFNCLVAELCRALLQPHEL